MTAAIGTIAPFLSPETPRFRGAFSNGHFSARKKTFLPPLGTHRKLIVAVYSRARDNMCTAKPANLDVSDKSALLNCAPAAIVWHCINHFDSRLRPMAY
ncbi:hypothetical protein MESS4_210035 [Mesorhizobium sp. STM 4661]|nr:hypothetical protein MESS4_210035 [Mesorhizobium sp. STM 4661]